MRVQPWVSSANKLPHAPAPGFVDEEPQKAALSRTVPAGQLARLLDPRGELRLVEPVFVDVQVTHLLVLGPSRTW